MRTAVRARPASAPVGCGSRLARLAQFRGHRLEVDDVSAARCGLAELRGAPGLFAPPLYLLRLSGLKNDQTLSGQAAEVALLDIPSGRVPLLRRDPQVTPDRVQGQPAAAEG